jgi:hypothetical protein
MPAITRTAMLLVLMLTGFVAYAQQAYINIEQRLTPEQLRETGLNTLSPAQLEALNRLLRDEDSVKTVQIEKAIEKANDEKKQNTASYIGLDDKPIKSRLVGSVSGWDIDTVFELENGQKWKVLKGNMKLRKPLTSPEIIVVPGIAGRWFLQVDEDSPKARVYRID